MALTIDEWRERLLDQGIDEATADLMCREYADDEEDTMPIEPLTTAYGSPITVTHEVDAVHVQVGGRVPYTLEPAAAAALADRLREEAQNAIHAERVGRRKTT